MLTTSTRLSGGTSDVDLFCSVPLTPTRSREHDAHLSHRLLVPRFPDTKNKMSTEKEAKPRDTRLMHLLLSSLNVPSYEENVPLQLLTFAHQYVHSALTDAQTFQDHRNAKEMEASDVKLAIASKMNHSFKGAPPKEFLLELAGERNRRALPSVNAGYGLRLPPEKYCLT